jgi:hypothetical protein
LFSQSELQARSKVIQSQSWSILKFFIFGLFRNYAVRVKQAAERKQGHRSTGLAEY